MTELRWFEPEEFYCPCGRSTCEAPRSIAPELGVALDVLRTKLRRPLIVTSACRCAWHNARLGGEADSQHLTGRAADLLIASSAERFQLLKYAPTYFRRIGLAAKHLHVDTGASPLDVCWLEAGT